MKKSDPSAKRKKSTNLSDRSHNPLKSNGMNVVDDDRGKVVQDKSIYSLDQSSSSVRNENSISRSLENQLSKSSFGHSSASEINSSNEKSSFFATNSTSASDSDLPAINTAYFKPSTLDHLRKSGVYIKRGKFSQTECKIVEEKINIYLHENGISEAEFLEYIQNPTSSVSSSAKKIAGVALYVAKWLPGRYVNSVNQFLKRRYNIYNHHGKWTLEEDQKLLQLYALNGRNWKATAIEIGRTALNCKDRLKYLEGYQCQSSGSVWNEQEEQRLKEIVLRHLEGQHDLFVNWVAVARELGTKNEKQCSMKWHYDLSNRNISKRDLAEFTLQEDKAICEAIMRRQYLHEKDIVWSDVFRDVPNRSRASISLRWRHLKRAIPNVREFQSLDELVRAILAQIEQQKPAAEKTLH